MESLEEVIRFLQAMSQNMNNQTPDLRPTLQKQICEAGLPQTTLLPSVDQLCKDAETLDIVQRYGYQADAKYYCFVPTIINTIVQNYKVYLIDSYHHVIAKLEDYTPPITDSTTRTGIEYSFIIPIS